MLRICVIAFSFFTSGLFQIITCPVQWQTFSQTCYYFQHWEPKDYTETIKQCDASGAAVVSVNSLEEHNFIVQQLRRLDADGYLWYTSGMVNDIDTSDIIWQGDGSVAATTMQWWLSEEDSLLRYPRIAYKSMNGNIYGWSRVQSSERLLYICEIPLIEAYRISQLERDFTYGTNFTAPALAPRGPKFIVQPRNIVVIEDSRPGYSVSIECFADGIPMVTYIMRLIRSNGTTTEINSNSDHRYTLSGGRLVIQNPREREDAGSYQCVATNEFGTVHSDLANMTFGELRSFSNVQRAPILANEYESAVIECSPPQFKPAISYQWYRGTYSDFVRPDLNPHMFISSNGKLYISEVTKSDEGDYHCIVKLTSGGEIMSASQPPSRVSLAIPLKIRYSGGSTWGPVIADGFIASFPNKPLRGNTVTLECLAYGTLPFTYSWYRKDYPLPDNIILTDHKRILQITNVQLEDSGTYYCTVTRKTGARAQAAHNLVIENRPYFMFPLRDQHVDTGSQLTWRCEAKAIPKAIYQWYKDGNILNSVNGDIEIRRNVLTIKKLDNEKHSGMYQCMAVNTHGLSYSSGQLRVLAFTPSFAKHPLNPSQTSALGSQMTIECNPEAAPKPEFSWSRNGVNINAQPDDGTSRVRLLANGDLYISDVQYSDAGHYCCLATNTYGSDSSCSNISVVANTVLTRGPVNTVGRVNSTVAMLCQASFPGEADSVYVWLFNGRPINLKKQYHYKLGIPQYPGALYVVSAQFEHTGTYTCVAKTTFDVKNASAVLTIQGPPGEPAGVRVDSRTITSTSATVLWTAGDNHGIPVTSFIIEACTENNKTWITLVSNIPESESSIPGTERHAFNVKQLKPGNGYYFRVRAVSAFGIGVPSKSSPVYKIQEAAPLKYPDNISGGGGSVGLLTITWEPLKPEDRGGADAGYLVYWRRPNTTLVFTKANITDVGVGSHTVTVGIENFYLLYEVKVVAYNKFGTGPTSPDGVFIYSAENMPIGIVTNLYAFPYNATALQVTWQPMTNNRETMRGKLLGYQVNFQLRNVPDASLDAISWRGETDSGIVIGLDPHTWYTVDVQALNTAGMGDRSEVYHAKTYKKPPTLYPTEIEIYTNANKSVRIQWRGVSTSSDEENMEGYKVRYWLTNDVVQSAKDIITGRTETEVVIYGLQKDFIYECRVLAFSRGGDGKQSSSVYFTMGGRVAFDPNTSEIRSSTHRIYPRTLHFMTLLICVILFIYLP